MKRLISIIVLAILTMSLVGCVVVDEHYHHRRGPDAVIVTRPWPGPYHYGHYHRDWYRHHGY
jgi:hypothetical protein